MQEKAMELMGKKLLAAEALEGIGRTLRSSSLCHVPALAASGTAWLQIPQYRSPATVNQKLAVVLAWWEDAFAEGHTDARPPSARMRDKLRLKTPKRSPRAWTEKQFKNNLRHVKAAPERSEWNRNHLEALLQTVYYTGALINGLLACTLMHLGDSHLYLQAEYSKTDEEKPCQLPAWLIERLRSLYREPEDVRLFPLPFTVSTLRGHLK
jgi:hypothetical protein